MSVPYLVAMLNALDIDQYTLTVGDTREVVDKWIAAYTRITDHSGDGESFTSEINTLAAWIEATHDSIPTDPTTTVSAAGAARDSASYKAVISGTSVSVEDVYAGRRLIVTNIAALGDLPTQDVFLAEIAPDSTARWAGPLVSTHYIVTALPSAEPPEDEEGPTGEEIEPPPKPAINIAPIARAGPDVSINLGATFTRSAGASSDPDGVVVKYEWSEGASILTTAKTLTVTPVAVGVRTFSLVVTDNQGARSAADTVQLTTEAAASTSDYDLAARPSGDPAVKITTNTDIKTRTITGSRRPVFFPDGHRILVARGARTSTNQDTYDVLTLDGYRVKRNIPAEFEAMPSFTDDATAYGIRNFKGNSEDALMRCDWAADTHEHIYEPDGLLSLGDGQGRISNDDRYAVVRRKADDTLLSIDMNTNTILGSLVAPAGYSWASVTPDGAYILVGTTVVTRYTKSFGGATQISATNDAGDCAIGADSKVYFVQTGAAAKRIDVAANTSITIDTSATAVSGSVSGVSLVPGYVCVAWRVGGVHEVATMDIADGTAMWTSRVTWGTLAAGTETRAYAQPAATPSSDGTMIIYRASVTPDTGDVNLYLLS